MTCNVTKDVGETHVASGDRVEIEEWDTSGWDTEEPDQGYQSPSDNYDHEVTIEPPTVDQPTGWWHPGEYCGEIQALRD